MLRVAPDASTIERLMDDLYPGGIEVLEWEKCLVCDLDVDGYIYVAGLRQGYCNEHYNLEKDKNLVSPEERVDAE